MNNPSSYRAPFLRVLFSGVLTLCALINLPQNVFAEPLKVVIVAPTNGSPAVDDFNSIGGIGYFTVFQDPSDPWYTNDEFPRVNYDLEEVKNHLSGLLNGSEEYQGSEVTVVQEFRGLNSLFSSFTDHFFGHDAYTTLVNKEYDVVILMNDPSLLTIVSSAAFEGVLNFSNHFLARGSDVYLMEPDHETFQVSTKELIHRMANGCGIDVIPAGETLRQTTNFYGDHFDSAASFIMSGSIFSTITSGGVASGSSYHPESSSLSVTNVESLEDEILSVIATEKTTVQYTDSYNGKGEVLHRPLDLTQAPYDHRFAYARTGSSTENQIRLSLFSLVDDHYLAHGDTPITPIHTQVASANRAISHTFLPFAEQSHYVLAFGRGQLDDIGVYENGVNVSNTLAMPYARHAGDEYEEVLGVMYQATSSTAATAYIHNGLRLPSLHIIARFRQFYPDFMFSYDGTHQINETIDAIASAYLTCAAGLDFDNDELNRRLYYREADPYFIGWNTIMQQSFLSEDRRNTPDVNMDITTRSLPVATAAAPLDIALVATGGTAPYTWEETTGNLPEGVDLHINGQLQGNAVGVGGSYQLVFKVTDANGGIHKQALELTSEGYGLDESLYGWDTRYCFDTRRDTSFIDGDVVVALNGGTSAVTVAGLTFSPYNMGGGFKDAYPSATFPNGISSTGDSSYDALLGSLSVGSSYEERVILSGLVPGESYALQLFYNNKNNADGYESQMHAWIDGYALQVDLHAEAVSAGSDDYGSYGVARFIASGSEVELILRSQSDEFSIKGKAGFNALLLTRLADTAPHDGVSQYATMTWDTPTSVVGVEDFVAGRVIQAINGGDTDVSIGSLGVVFENRNIGYNTNETTAATNAFADDNFALLMSEQTRTDYHHTMTLDGFTPGKRYQVQVFNKAKPLSLYTSIANGGYDGSDTSFGLFKQGAQRIYADEEVVSSVGTFTARSSRQVLEMHTNESNPINHISFSAIYVVEIPGQDGVLAHWSMDDGAGSVVSDDTGNGYNGTLTGGAWLETGRTAGALCFDADGSIEIPESAFDSVSDEFTIMMWVYGGDNQPRQDTVFRATSANGNRVFNVHLPWSDSTVFWDVGSGTESFSRVSKVASAEQFMGEWNHWAFTVKASSANEAGTMAIYLNGELWHSGAVNLTSIGNVSNAYLASAGGNSHYSGCMDEVAIFNRALAASEISGSYASYTKLRGYQRWLSDNVVAGDTGVNGDSDNDGVLNLIEYALRGDPRTTDPAILPTVVEVTNGYLFSFELNAEAALDTTTVFEYSSDLIDGEWITVDMDSREVTMGPEVNGMQPVDIIINSGEAVGGKLFGRVRVLLEE